MRRWAEERAEARAGRDFARADRLRDLIAGAGWAVTDRPGGFDLTPATPPEPAVSLLLDVEGWLADAERLLGSLPPDPTVEIVAVDRSPQPGGDWLAGWKGPSQHIVADADTGFGASRNIALRRAAGSVVVLVDTSLEVTGDLLGTLQAALADPTVAAAGPFGLASTDLREYEERTQGEVVAVQGYCLAARRSDLLAIGGVRESFSFYRNADIDTSLRLRTLGSELLRAVAVGADQCRRHAHRAWEATPPEERDRLSGRNLRRLLDRFGDRVSDLAVP